MNTLRHVIFVFALSLSWVSVAHGQIIFNFTYQDAPGTGFNAAGALGQTRRDTLQAVADYISATVSAPGPRTVNLDVLPSNTANGIPWLAVAGVATIPLNFTFNKSVVQQIVQSGFNPGPGPVGTLQWNFAPDAPWGYTTAVTVPDYDFRSTALHELTHQLGWSTRMTATGTSASGTAAYAYYDQYVQGWNGSAYVNFVNTTAGSPDGTTISAAALTNTANPLRFSGPFANAAGGPFPLTTMPVFQPGSSVGHFSNLSDVMGDSAAPGPRAQTYSPAGIAVLKDLGYTLTTAGLTIVESGGSTSVAEGGATDTFTVALNSVPTANVTVTLNPGTQLTVAPAVLTFTPANWNTAQTVTVTAVDDVVVEGPHTGTIAFTLASTDTTYNGLAIPNRTVNITDNDGAPSGVTIVQSGGSTTVAEGGATDTFTAVLNSAPTANVTVTLNPGTQLTVAPAVLTFTPANWNTAQTVTVTAVDDAASEGPHTGTIAFTLASTDTAYNGLAIPNLTVSITDNEVSGLTIVQSGGSTSVVEGGATDTFTVVLNSAPTANVTVTLNAGTQVIVAPAALTFTPANWNTPQTVTVTAVDDAASEGPHTGTVAFTTASTDALYNALVVPSVTVAITDNDGAPPQPPQPPSGGEGAHSGGGPLGGEGAFRMPAATLAGPFPQTRARDGGNSVVINVAHKQRAQGQRQASLGQALGWTIASGLILGLAAALVFGKKKG